MLRSAASRGKVDLEAQERSFVSHDLAATEGEKKEGQVKRLSLGIHQPNWTIYLLISSAVCRSAHHRERWFRCSFRYQTIPENMSVFWVVIEKIQLLQKAFSLA